MWHREERGAEQLVRDLVSTVGPVPIGAEVPRAARQQRWSPLNVPLMCGAESTEHTTPLMEWFVATAIPMEVPLEFHEGGISPSEAARVWWSSLREVTRGRGIQVGEDLSIWLRNNGFAGSAPGNHIATRAQEFFLREAVAVDARVSLLEAVYVCLTVRMSRQLAVESRVTEMPRRAVQRRTPSSTFPKGSWEQLDEVDLTDFFLLRLSMLKSCSHFLKSRLRESFGAALAENSGRSRLVMSWAS